MPAFEYQPLDPNTHQIRLVRLQPRNHRAFEPWNWILFPEKSPLVPCSIEHFAFTSAPSYQALSYTWGDASQTRPILLNDSLFRVTKNLEVALRHLQDEHETLTLWIDALCINQNDDVEKSSQVQQMRTVYQTAALVIVWLGHSADHSGLVLTKLELAGQRASSYLGSAPSASMVKNFALSFTAGGEDTDFPLNAIESLLGRSWWQRIWVMQELAVSREALFVCGCKRVSGYYFARGLDMFTLRGMSELFRTLAEREANFDNWAMSLMYDTRPALMIRQWQKQGNVASSLLELLKTTCLSGKYASSTGALTASDPRDLVFALLGLADDAADLNIQPDYSKSCQAVFTEVARAFLTQGRLEILSLCQFTKLQTELPSWVPDWVAEIGPQILINRVPQFCASGKSQPQVETQSGVDGFGTVLLSGMFWDDVQTVGCSYVTEVAQGTDPSNAGKVLAGLEGLYRLRPDIYQDESQLEDAVWRTAIANTEIDEDMYGWHPASNRSHHGYKVLLGKADRQSSESSTAASLYHTALKRTWEGRHAFMSIQGFLGLGPQQSRPGDKIVIFLGAKVPYIPTERRIWAFPAYRRSICPWYHGW
jgi:Heterokaryon incompatibility protein (HET)